jgi:hypothetical protein
MFPFIVTHETNAVSEALFVALFNRNRDKVLAGLDLDALLPKQTKSYILNRCESQSQVSLRTY